MRRILFFSSLFYLFSFLHSEVYAQGKERVYLLPGQGSDSRIFQRLSLDSNRYDTVHVHYPLPNRRENMQSYAQRIAGQIDTSEGTYSLVGVSLGGMLSCELNELLDPRKVIIVSSAKQRSELPFGYRTQRAIPIYKLVPAGVVKASAFILQPLFEPDRRKHKEVFKSMLSAKDKRFLKRAIRLIVTWDGIAVPEQIVHIHGSNDHTLPIRNIEADYVLEGSSHMMMLNDTPDIQRIVEQELSKMDDGRQ